MFENLNAAGDEGSGVPTCDDEFLRELERNTTQNICTQRMHERVQLRCGVSASNANSIDRQGAPWVGSTLDISAGGFLAVYSVPLALGSVYLLRFDRARIDLPPTFARCIRGRMISEDAFEFGFSFFAKIDLAEALAGASMEATSGTASRGGGA